MHTKLKLPANQPCPFPGILSSQVVASCFQMETSSTLPPRHLRLPVSALLLFLPAQYLLHLTLSPLSPASKRPLLWITARVYYLTFPSPFPKQHHYTLPWAWIALFKNLRWLPIVFTSNPNSSDSQTGVSTPDTPYFPSCQSHPVPRRRGFLYLLKLDPTSKALPKFPLVPKLALYHDNLSSNIPCL